MDLHVYDKFLGRRTGQTNELVSFAALSLLLSRKYVVSQLAN